MKIQASFQALLEVPSTWDLFATLFHRRFLTLWICFPQNYNVMKYFVSELVIHRENNYWNDLLTYFFLSPSPSLKLLFFPNTEICLVVRSITWAITSGANKIEMADPIFFLQPQLYFTIYYEFNQSKLQINHWEMQLILYHNNFSFTIYKMII